MAMKERWDLEQNHNTGRWQMEWRQEWEWFLRLARRESDASGVGDGRGGCTVDMTMVARERGREEQCYRRTRSGQHRCLGVKRCNDAELN